MWKAALWEEKKLLRCRGIVGVGGRILRISDIIDFGEISPAQSLA